MLFVNLQLKFFQRQCYLNSQHNFFCSSSIIVFRSSCAFFKSSSLVVVSFITLSRSISLLSVSNNSTCWSISESDNSLTGVKKFKNDVAACTIPLAILLNTPVPSSILNKNPSHAELNLVVSPAKLSSLVSASL